MKLKSLNGRTKTIVIVLIGVAVAAGAGLYLSGMVGGKAEKPVKDAVIEPVALAEPFVINLADEEVHYAKLNVALQLAPMTAEDQVLFSSGGGGGHGAAGPTGPERVAGYPKFRDALIEVTSKFTYGELLTEQGKAHLKAELLERFEQIAKEDTMPKPKNGEEEHHDPSTAPYHVENLYFTEFALQ